MESQINSLEIKMRQMLELCQNLRVENQKLRQQIAVADDHNKQLSERVIYARTRMESLLAKIPGAEL